MPNVRKSSEVLLLLVVIAFFVRLLGAPENVEQVAQPIAQELSIRGIKLGMSRAEVVHQLGEPLLEKASESNPLYFTIAMYKDAGPFGDPQITYDAKARVVAVSGESLEWRTGQLTKETSQTDIQEFFPNPKWFSRPAYHPWSPGRSFYPKSDLIIQTSVESLFGSAKFWRAELQVPFMYPMDGYWRESNAPGPLGRIARLTRKNRSRLETAETIGCFFCIQIVQEPPVFYDYNRDTGACPECGGYWLLTGTREKVTLGLLSELNTVWMNPYHDASRLAPDIAKSVFRSAE